MMSEGCLTFPYLFLNIKRPRKIQVQYEDDEGKEINRDFEGMFSRIYQHEYDHTLGITFVEKVSKLKFDMAKKKAEKMYKRDLQRAEMAKSRQT
jgi:peptide deformylase